MSNPNDQFVTIKGLHVWYGLCTILALLMCIAVITHAEVVGDIALTILFFVALAAFGRLVYGAFAR